MKTDDDGGRLPVSCDENFSLLDFPDEGGDAVLRIGDGVCFQSGQKFPWTRTNPTHPHARPAPVLAAAYRKMLSLSSKTISSRLSVVLCTGSTPTHRREEAVGSGRAGGPDQGVPVCRGAGGSEKPTGLPHWQSLSPPRTDNIGSSKRPVPLHSASPCHEVPWALESTGQASYFIGLLSSYPMKQTTRSHDLKAKGRKLRTCEIPCVQCNQEIAGASDGTFHHHVVCLIGQVGSPAKVHRAQLRPQRQGVQHPLDLVLAEHESFEVLGAGDLDSYSRKNEADATTLTGRESNSRSR